MKDKIIAIVVIIGVFVFAVWYIHTHHVVDQVLVENKTVVYGCDAGKSITATFHLPADVDVTLVLSDGRNMVVPHAISGSGARYANADESFVFWNKGNTAFITEGAGTNSTTTFSNCVEKDAGQGDNALSTYTNDQYGFTVQFPSTLLATTTFKKFYILNTFWRVEAQEGTKGITLVSIPVFRVDQGSVATGKPYPLYFDAEVRVGVSSNKTDVANCLKPDPSYTKQPESDVVIQGVTFKKFSFQDSAMMQYMQGESYRTIHDGMCFAVEQIKTGSNYRDDTMKPGIPDDVLGGYYDLAGSVIQSFHFTK